MVLKDDKKGLSAISLVEKPAIQTNFVKLKEEKAPIKKENNTESISEKTVIKKDENSRQDKFTLTLEPNQGKEIKLTMLKGASVSYSPLPVQL